MLVAKLIHLQLGRSTLCYHLFHRWYCWDGKETKEMIRLRSDCLHSTFSKSFDVGAPETGWSVVRAQSAAAAHSSCLLARGASSQTGCQCSSRWLGAKCKRFLQMSNLYSQHSNSVIIHPDDNSIADPTESVDVVSGMLCIQRCMISAYMRKPSS